MPLVEQIHAGYRCADLLLLLPGSIPIPSFKCLPALPSYDWIDPITNALRPQVVLYLTGSSVSVPLLPGVSYQSDPSSRVTRNRQVVDAPLIVRHPSQDIYTPEGWRRLLSSIGVPDNMQVVGMKILIVSFGGQIFRRPHSRNNSRPVSRDFGRDLSSELNKAEGIQSTKQSITEQQDSRLSAESIIHSINNSHSRHPSNGLSHNPVHHSDYNAAQRLTTPSHLWVPGAPPAVKNPSPIISSKSQFSSNITIQPPTPRRELDLELKENSMESISISQRTSLVLTLPRLLPDSSWIAIVCGVSKQWGQEDGEELPEGFFIAPRDVYMPDLTAVADVLLGKLVSQDQVSA